MLPTSLVPLLLALTAPASALDLSEGQRLALDAFKLEFVREDVTAPPAEIAAAFRRACDRSYQPACKRASWIQDDVPNLQAVAAVLDKPCENGDPVACLVVSWALDEAAPGSDDPERTWRSGARLLKMHCDSGFQSACHDYGYFLQDNKGLKADPRAAAIRWQAACDAGVLASCTVLGTQSLEGAPGVERNTRKGLDLLEAACKKSHPAACHAWGGTRERTWTSEQVHTFYDDLCTRGHRDSCWRLGMRYVNGTLEAPTPGAGIDLLRRGCALGHASACYEAGRHYTAGESPAWDTAAEHFERGCHLGESDACKELVDLFLQERAPGSLKTHRFAFESACMLEDHLKSCTLLALGLMQGVDMPRDPYRARELLQRSCVDATSAADACVALGQTFEEGIGGDRDRTVASRYYHWSCYADRFDACERRGELLITGVGVRRDDREALAMFERACQSGMPRSCHRAGVILDEATFVTRDIKRAADHYQAACEGGVANACAGLGKLREEGLDGVPDFKAARAAYELGIAKDDVECRRRMSRLLYNALGGKREKGRARALASEACQKGDPVACRGPAFL